MTEVSGSQAAATGADSDPLVGTTLGGRYAIERIVGWGGMGVVYLAKDAKKNDREVVVKVLARQLLHDEQAQQRFDREAASLKSLRHANIVEMYGFEREADRGYIVMEYLDGELLSTYLAEHGALTVGEFVPIAAQVLKGAGYAHSREVVLRDIKPENMMLCERKGRANFVKMLDFGLAKLLNDDRKITKQEVIGTIGYIAPEVIAGKAADLRADVYALGVMFFHMLAGQLPFPPGDLSQAALLYKTVNDEAPPLGELIPDGHEIPDELISLVHDCLKKDPDDRPADANVVVERLIDAVPTALFRLPQSAVHSGTFAARLARRERPASDVFTRPTAEVAVPETEAVQGLSAGTSAGSDGVAEKAFEKAKASEKPSREELAPPPDVEDEAAPQSSSRMLWVGAAAAVLLAVGVAMGLGLGKDDPSTPPVKTAAAGSARPTAAAAATQGDARPAPVAVGQPVVPEQPRDEGAPTPAVVEGALSITSTPEGASVLLDDAVVGTTPYEGTAPAGRHTVVVRAEGHEDWTQTVVIAEDADAEVSLAAELAPAEVLRPRGRRGARRGRRDGSRPAEPTAVEPTETPESKPVVPKLPSGTPKSSRSDELLTETGSKKKSSVLLPGSN